MTLAFPARLERDEDGITVSFRDIPEALTCSDDLPEARQAAQDCLITALVGYALDGRAIPSASVARSDEEMIALNTVLEKKLALFQGLRRRGLAPEDAVLAFKGGEAEAARLLDLDDETPETLLDAALAKLR
jgi:antitoxin HicB